MMTDDDIQIGKSQVAMIHHRITNEPISSSNVLRLQWIEIAHDLFKLFSSVDLELEQDAPDAIAVLDG